MPTLQKTALAAALVFCANGAFAQSEDLSYVSDVSFAHSISDADLRYAFGDATDLQVVALNAQQMEETEGAALPIAYMGGAAFVGALWNVNDYATKVPMSQRTFGGYATAIGTGLVGGAITATPIGAIRAPIIGSSIMMTGQGIARGMKK